MSDYVGSNPVGLYGLDSSPSLQANEDTSTNGTLRLTAKPHAFAGAVLSPKHARELTPAHCLQIASALADQSHHKNAVPYTLWITEAWRVLGWAEPSAALFWEMATMYHTLLLAGRSAYETASLNLIPPILSCGSTSSIGSGATNSAHTERSNPASVLGIDKKKFSSAVSAKELPVWLVGTFLLLHCEEFAYQRNLSGEDERRFYGGNVTSSAAASGGGAAAAMDFTSLFKHPLLSPRTRLHAGWNNDYTHCTAYLLRHLRKILLLTAVSHNPDAFRACTHLAAIPSPPAHEQVQQQPASLVQSNAATAAGASGTVGGRMRGGSSSSTNTKQYSAIDLRRQHDDEHGNVGLSVRLTMEDLERLDLVLQPPSGGGIDDLPLKMGEFLWQCLYHDPPPPTASIPLGDVEREIRQHLELELAMNDQDEKDEVSSDEEENAEAALARLHLTDGKSNDANEGDDRAKQPNNHYQKELSYTRLRGTTILLKPNPMETSSGASAGSGGEPNFVGNLASAGRLHDLAISDCSDAHFYLLQPFEHATIAGCTNCTIVVGAVAGLLHVVDCEKTTFTSASRRILVSNSCDVQLCVFTPSPPILVGDNRSCQFAPYNTYYDGLREDLLAAGLAAAVLPENQPPILSGRAAENDAAWPPLQCASNKWKQPVEVSKLEVPQVPGSSVGSPTGPSAPSSPGADDKAMGKSGTGSDASMHAPVLVPVSEFNILFVPLESDSARQRRTEAEEADSRSAGEGNSSSGANTPLQSQYSRLLAEVLQLSPFRLPIEYERRVLMKAERMRNIQQSVQKNLTADQQRRFEEELNRGFRDWLVSSGNLRQVLDLVHLERKGGV